MAGEAHLGHLDLTGYRYGFRQVRGPRRAMGRSQYGFYKTTSLPNAQEGGPPFSKGADTPVCSFRVMGMRRVSVPQSINQQRSYGIRNTWGVFSGDHLIPHSMHGNPSKCSLLIPFRIPDGIQYARRSLRNRLIVGSLGRVVFQPLFLELWIFATTRPAHANNMKGYMRESLQ